MANVYACSGSCKGVVTEKQHASGLNKCATKGCEKIGKPLGKTIQCASCSAKSTKDGSAHFCEACVKA